MGWVDLLTDTERDSGQIAHQYKIEVVARPVTQFSDGAY
jgi:hypothetical protein